MQVLQQAGADLSFAFAGFSCSMSWDKFAGSFVQIGSSGEPIR